MKLPVSHCHQLHQLHPAQLSLKRNPVGQSHDSVLLWPRSGCKNDLEIAAPPSEEQETEATTHTRLSLRLDNRRWKMSPGSMTHRFCPDIPTVGSEAKQHENMGRSCLVSKVRAAAAVVCGAVEDVFMANFKSLVTNLALLEPNYQCPPSFLWL